MLREFDFEKLPIVEVVNEIILDAALRKASDIHFDPMFEYMKVRIRIDGELQDYAKVPNTLKRNLITRIKIISGMNITEVRLPQDGAIKTKIKDSDLDLRVSCIPTSNGEKIVVRILDYSMSLQGIDNLGFTESNFNKLNELINIPNGIILVTGATGTGKSTTVYSILQKLNSPERNIVSVEDPIEMDIEGINQIQVNSDIGLDFANVLRSILRQDPNVIMIGEIRDNETARIAVRASITGHLVLSTIHTNNSLNTIERLLDMDVERYLLASALKGVISQKLARRLCDNCKTTSKVSTYEKNLIKKVLNKDIEEIYAPVGCSECNKGYRGRIAIHEVLVITQEIRDALANNLRKEDLRTLVYRSNVTTLLQDGLLKVLNGNTTMEEVVKLIELDDDVDGKMEDYKYNLDKAIKDVEIVKKGNSENDFENIRIYSTSNNKKETKDEQKVEEEPKIEEVPIIEEEPEVKEVTTNDYEPSIEGIEMNNPLILDK